MDKVLFTPFGIAAGIAAGFAGKLAFDQVWKLIDDQEPPEPDEREVEIAKLIAAMAIQGAIFRVVRGVAERGARRGFQRWSGHWPGEARPDPA